MTAIEPMSLTTLLSGQAIGEGSADNDPLASVNITGLTLDSRQVQPGDAFVALPGAKGHGLEHAAEAVKRGAVAVLFDQPGKIDPTGAVSGDQVPVVHVPGLRQCMAPMAARLHRYPSSNMTLVGVTGTNGKTTCCHLLSQALSDCAYVGTLGSGWAGAIQEGSHTTPDVLSLQRILANLHTQGARAVALEVSSHALDQGRVEQIDFDLAVFTNLTRDHLDYHNDMAAYEQAKTRLFDSPGLSAAIVNLDDPAGRRIAQSLDEKVVRIGYGFSPSTDSSDRPEVCASQLELNARGLSMMVESPWGSGRISAPLLGRFNAANVLAVVAALGALGYPFSEIASRVGSLQPVPGRMATLGGDGDQAPLVIIDYAHTPDALEKALTAAREHVSGELICVFGCGGERDRGKRPLMGGIAARLSDQVVVTDDNPRGEDGDAIVSEILTGIEDTESVQVIRDRSQAIRQTIIRSGPGDAVLIAGKGHESYQEVAGEKIPFEDHAVASAALAGMTGQASMGEHHP